MAAFESRSLISSVGEKRTDGNGDSVRQLKSSKIGEGSRHNGKRSQRKKLGGEGGKRRKSERSGFFWDAWRKRVGGTRVIRRNITDTRGKRWGGRKKGKGEREMCRKVDLLKGLSFNTI